jgi:hypothetical protein
MRKSGPNTGKMHGAHLRIGLPTYRPMAAGRNVRDISVILPGNCELLVSGYVSVSSGVVVLKGYESGITDIRVHVLVISSSLVHGHPHSPSPLCDPSDFVCYHVSLIDTIGDRALCGCYYRSTLQFKTRLTAKRCGPVLGVRSRVLERHGEQRGNGSGECLPVT